MKIGLVLDDTLDTPDGVQQYVLTLGNWLTSQGHEVHYLVGQTTRTDIPNIHSLSRNMHVRYNGNRLSIPLPTSKKQLRKLLAELQLDLLHIQTPYSPLLAGRMLRMCSAQTAVVGTFHVLPYSKVVRLANRLLALLNRRTARRFDHMIADSEPARTFAKSTYGFTASVIPNPFPLHQFLTTDTTPPVANIQVLFLGRLVERKGVRYLLEAIAYLKEHQMYSGDFTVKIGGKGELLPKLLTYVAEHGLQDVVSFTGFVAEADKAQFLASSDIAVFPSTSGESFGISLLEGMAGSRGVVLGGDNPGYRSVLQPLNENRLVTPQDTPGFAKQLVVWLEDAGARKAASMAQKDYVQQFDIDIVGRRVEAVYNQALQSRSKS